MSRTEANQYAISTDLTDPLSLSISASPVFLFKFFFFLFVSNQLHAAFTPSSREQKGQQRQLGSRYLQMLMADAPFE